MKFSLDLGGSTLDLFYIHNNNKNFDSRESKFFDKNIQNIQNVEKILDAFHIFHICKNTQEKHMLYVTGGYSNVYKHALKNEKENSENNKNRESIENIDERENIDETVIIKNILFEIVIIPEFTAIGKGAELCSGKKTGIAVSLGTGTAMVLFHKNTQTYTHIKGTGLGGGTFIALSSALLDTTDFDEISSLANKGNKENIDLSVGDIVGGSIGVLPAHATASNFAKYSKNSSREDIALGLSTLIAESITALAIEKCLRYKETVIVFGGKFSQLAVLKKHVLSSMKLFGITAIFPENSEYMTVIGAMK